MGTRTRTLVGAVLLAVAVGVWLEGFTWLSYFLALAFIVFCSWREDTTPETRAIKGAARICLILALVPPWEVYQVWTLGVEEHQRVVWGPLIMSPPYRSTLNVTFARVHMPLLLAEWGAVVLVFALRHYVFRRSDAQDGAGPGPGEERPQRGS